ncbi:MAG: thioredoxin domain-containing protein [Candidatus Bipolaricaulis sp.]|nr:thioredoxin domain-containing protein [Candidatus Bipolaricaulis sp.]MDD5645582.1 thioredoxin domain-containing protein [Candidatus Bipolaricaulis sp.]
MVHVRGSRGLWAERPSAAGAIVLGLALLLAAVACSGPAESRVAATSDVTHAVLAPESASETAGQPPVVPEAVPGSGVPEAQQADTSAAETPVALVKGESPSVGGSVAVEETAAVAVSEKAKLPRLVDLGAGKCIPCKKMAPILEELADTHKAFFEVEFIDVWVNPDRGKEYGVRIIPTQIFYDAQGREVYRHIGFYSKEDILGRWRELGVDVGA